MSQQLTQRLIEQRRVVDNGGERFRQLITELRPTQSLAKFSGADRSIAEPTPPSEKQCLPPGSLDVIVFQQVFRVPEEPGNAGVLENASD